MREREIEEYLRDKVKGLKGIAYKFESPGNVGVPDRLIVLPGGKVCFVELKAPRGKLSQMQAKQIERLKNLKADVRIIKSKQEVDEFIEYCKSQIGADSNAICTAQLPEVLY